MMLRSGSGSGSGSGRLSEADEGWIMRILSRERPYVVRSGVGLAVVLVVAVLCCAAYAQVVVMPTLVPPHVPPQSYLNVQLYLL